MPKYAQKVILIYMRVFTANFRLAAVMVCALLFASPLVHAQKWNALKKAFSSPRLQASAISWRAKAERVILRATMRPPRLPYSSQVTFQQGAYHFATPRALLPTPGKLTSVEALPPFPLPQKDTEMYRGMLLDENGQDLRHILQRGLEVSKSHYENFAAYNGLQYPGGTKAIYAAAKYKHALYFMLPENTAPCLPVLLHLKRVGWRDIISVPHDIPPSWIYRVSTLLEVNGKLTWGELKLKKGIFVFTPYPTENGQAASK